MIQFYDKESVEVNMLSKNIKFKGQLKTNTWRKIALNSWDPDFGCSIYSKVELNPTPALKFLEKFNQENNQKITLTHYLGKVLGILLREYPLLNCTIRGKKVYQRENCDIFFQISRPSQKGEEDLSGKVIREVDKKDLTSIAQELSAKGKVIKHQEDTTFKYIKKIVSLTPDCLIKYLINISAFIQLRLNLWSPLLGTKQDTFGSMMMTNIGVFDIEEAFVPFVRYSGVHSICCMGAIYDGIDFDGDKVVKSKKINLCWTLDHRLIDGSTAGKMLKTLKGLFENPNELLKEFSSVE